MISSTNHFNKNKIKYVPIISFSETKDWYGYPLAEYIAINEKGQPVEKTIPKDPSRELNLSEIFNPIKKIHRNFHPNQFFNMCKKYPLYKLTHVSKEIGGGPHFTALARAIYKDNLKLVKALIGVVPNEIVCQNTSKTAKTARELFVNQRMSGGLTAVMCACKYGNLKMVKILNQAGANLNLSMWSTYNAFSQGDTPLLIAIQEKEVDIIKFLILNGAELPRERKIAEVVRLIDMIGKEQFKWMRQEICIPSLFEQSAFFHEQFQKVMCQIKDQAWEAYKALQLRNTVINTDILPLDIVKVITFILIRMVPFKTWWSGQSLPNQNSLTEILKTYQVSLPIVLWPTSFDEIAAALFSGERDANGYTTAKYSVMTHYNCVIEKSESQNPNKTLSKADLVFAYESPIEKIEKNTTVKEFFKLVAKYPYYNLTHAHRGYTIDADLIKYDITQSERRLTALAMAVFKGNLTLVKDLINTVPNNILCPYTKMDARQLFVNQRMVGGLTAVFCIENIKVSEIRQKILASLVNAGANLNVSMWSDYHPYKKGDTPLLRAREAEDDELTEMLLKAAERSL